MRLLYEILLLAAIVLAVIGWAIVVAILALP